MSRSTGTLFTDGAYYEYMVTDGTYVYGLAGNGLVERFNYDGTGLIHVHIWEPGYDIIDNARGIVIANDMLWIVSRHDSNNTYLVQVATTDWLDSATPTGTQAVHMNDVIGGHGLATDSTGRYLYVVSEIDGVLGLYDTESDIQATYATERGSAIVRRSDQYYYMCTFDESYILELNFSDPMTISSTRTISLPFAPWQAIYDSIGDKFYISEQFASVYQFTPTYDEGELSSLSGSELTVESESLAICGYNKVYPDSNTYYDIFVSSSESGDVIVYYNNAGSQLGGDPIIKTLSGKYYTVPDYLEVFNYLTIIHNDSTLQIDCTTKRLTEKDFPYPIEGFNPVIDTDLYPHTYLDKVSIKIDNTVLYEVDMDTLHIEHTHNNTEYKPDISILKDNHMKWGTTNTKKLQINAREFGCTLSLSSDLHLLERHMIYTNIKPLSGAKMYGAVVDRPCHKFICSPCAFVTENNTGNIQLNINNHILNYTGTIPTELQHYLNNHKLQTM